MLNPERVILNLVQNLQGRLVSASHETLKRVQGDNTTSIATAFWTVIAGLRIETKFGRILLGRFLPLFFGESLFQSLRPAVQLQQPALRLP